MSKEDAQAALKDGPVSIGDGLYVVVLDGRIVRDNNRYRRFTSLEAAQQFLTAAKQGNE